LKCVFMDGGIADGCLRTVLADYAVDRDGAWLG
jgi:hypothetical protein